VRSSEVPDAHLHAERHALGFEHERSSSTCGIVVQCFDERCLQAKPVAERLELRERSKGIRGRLHQEPLSPLDQRIAHCLGFASERRLRLLTLKRPFREAACSVRRKAVAFVAGGQQAGRVPSALPRRPKFLCSRAKALMPPGIIPNFDAPGISPWCSSQSLLLDVSIAVFRES
jgi:hypothetical protein